MHYKLIEMIDQGRYEDVWTELEQYDINEYTEELYIIAITALLALENHERAREYLELGLRINGQSDELYLLLGNYYEKYNLTQAYICYENAEFYCRDAEDRKVIRAFKQRIEEENGYKGRKISIILLFLDSPDAVRCCVESIRKNTSPDLYEIITADSASPDELRKWLIRQEDITQISRDGERSCEYNQLIEAVNPESDILLLDSNTVLLPNSLFWLKMGLYENEYIGSTGSQTHIEPESETPVFLKDSYGYEPYLESPAIFIRREALEAVGLLDSRFIQGNLWAKDYGMRLSLAGWKNILCRNSITHNSRIEADQDKSVEKIFQEKWSGVQKFYKNISHAQSNIKKFRITAVGLIKNAADVIETFIRTNGLLVDNFVLLDNMCSDRTITILEQLQQEGFDIEIIEDNIIEHSQGKKMIKLIYYVYEKYHSDFILPVDDDECVVPSFNGISIDYVRNKIEQLPQNNLYYLKWKIYIPSKYDDENELCVAKRQAYCYGDSAETLNKIIIPGKILEDKTFLISEGNHQGDGNLVKEHIFLHFARMAHFPCRSEAQIRSKALTGWTNCLALPGRRAKDASQWKQIYSIVKRGEKLSLQDMQQMASSYIDYSGSEDIPIERDPVNLPEEAMIMKYTRSNEVNPWENYCTNVEMLAQKYAELLAKSEEYRY